MVSLLGSRSSSCGETKLASGSLLGTRGGFVPGA
jgi:hypothetical protein